MRYIEIADAADERLDTLEINRNMRCIEMRV